jgi:hypothetical protein
MGVGTDWLGKKLVIPLYIVSHRGKRSMMHLARLQEIIQ